MLYLFYLGDLKVTSIGNLPSMHSHEHVQYSILLYLIKLVRGFTVEAKNQLTASRTIPVFTQTQQIAVHLEQTGNTSHTINHMTHLTTKYHLDYCTYHYLSSKHQ